MTFSVLLFVPHAGEATFQTSWLMISLLTELAIVFVLLTHKSVVRSDPSKLLLWSTVAFVAATFAIRCLRILSAAFNFVPLSAAQLSTAVVSVLGYVVAMEVENV